MSLEQKAKEFATKAHDGQRRKYTNLPYITHPAAVVELVRSVDHTEEMLAASWLHDVVEDCGVSISEIREEFGDDVASLVDWLTDVSKPSDGNRERRKHLDMIHMANASPSAKTIKIADLIDNTLSIVIYDPEFAKVYLPEKMDLLQVLKEGDSDLWKRAFDQVNVLVKDGI
jgi:(p)ppGpp synthase/HD superfamily hydrolase